MLLDPTYMEIEAARISISTLTKECVQRILELRYKRIGLLRRSHAKEGILALPCQKDFKKFNEYFSSEQSTLDEYGKSLRDFGTRYPQFSQSIEKRFDYISHKLAPWEDIYEEDDKEAKRELNKQIDAECRNFNDKFPI